MRISSFEVKNLFGIFNHSIELNSQPPITIIHGPNGFGKTVMLKMLDSLFNHRSSYLRTIPFDEFNVLLDDGSSLQIRHMQSKAKRQATILVQGFRNGEELGSFKLETKVNEREFPLHIIDDVIPHLNRIGTSEWIDSLSGHHLDLTEVFEIYGDALPFRLPELRNIPEWLSSLTESPKVHLIDTNRLRSSKQLDRRAQVGKKVVELAVQRYAYDLADLIRTKLAESAALSQSLDRTFPARLVQSANSLNDNDDIRLKLSQLEGKRSRLKAAGLLDKDEDMGFQITNDSLDSHTRQVLSVYVQDVEKKLSVFDSIASKLALFESILNHRFFYKQISISKESGFRFFSTGGSPLSPSDLSSGEQHELVLLYELLFKVSPNSLILIDEPEISLHVAWQEQFLPDLEKITSLAPFDVLIATHSPQVIGERWDLSIELQGPPKTAAN